MQAAYAAVDVAADVQPFIDAMAEALSWADLVVCRAGALTVAELAVAGDHPHAVDDHQRINAEFLVKGGAGRCVIQQEMTTEQLIALLQQSRAELLVQAIAARTLARAEAALTVANICKELAA